MSGEFKHSLLKMFNTKAPIAKTFGMKLSYDENNNRANITLPYNPDLDHAGGAVHGGVITTLLDNAGWFTCALAREGFVLTSEMSLHLFRPAMKTELRAQGEVLRLGKRQAVAEMRCWDGAGKLVAHGIGTYTYVEKLVKRSSI